MWSWRVSSDWGDLAVWALLAVIILAVVLGAWWPTRRGNGE